MEKLPGRSPQVTRAMEQHLFVFPTASATCHVEMVSPRSDPSPIWAGRCCPSRRAKACSYLPSPMGNGIRLIASDCFPLKDTQILASQTAGLSLQGGLVLGAS